MFAQFNVTNDYEGAINPYLARNELPIISNSSKFIVKAVKNPLNSFERPRLKVKASNSNCTIYIDKIKQGPENIPAVIKAGIKYRDNKFSEYKMYCEDGDPERTWCAYDK